MYRVILLVAWLGLVIAGIGDQLQVSDFSRRKLGIYLSVLDANGDGVLEEDDYHQLADLFINACNWQLNESKIDEIHKTLMKQAWKAFAYDKRGKGKSVTESEYWTTMPKRVKDPKYKDDIMDMWTMTFRSIDIDNDNLMNLLEYSAFLRQLRGVDSSTTKQYYDSIDTNGDNILTSDEFVTGIHTFLSEEDEDHPSKWIFGPLDL